MKAGTVSRTKRGLQYVNFFNGSSVIKRRQDISWVMLKLVYWHPELLLSPNKLFALTHEKFGFTEAQFNELRNKDHIHKFFGIIQFNEDHIIQERLVTLGDYFEQHTLQENKRVIVQCFEFMREMWRHGFFESTFNFTINYGLTQSEEVKLVDVGECCFEKELLIRYVEDRLWQKQWSFTSLKDMELKRFVQDTAMKMFTTYNVNHRWEKSMKDQR